ncbi:hypothetical protein AX14_001376 [Amanita brunnescens Koide BX004]|nr:hypothetical protein AX14_001376 [Amanita brunnescens Koide BX004]
MAVVWQTSGHTTALRGLDPLSLQVKIIISVFFAIGVFYLFLILTTFRHYGDLDEVWQKRFRQMVETAATASRQYDQAYLWGTAPYPMTAEQPPGPPGMSFAPIIPNVGPPIQPVIPPPPIIPGDPYHIPSAQSMGIPQQQLAQYTMASRSGTPASVRLSPIDITTPFIPSLHIASQSPTASYRTQPYDNRYLSPNADTLYSIAEGEGQEPSSPAFRRSRVQSQPQRQYSNDTRSSTDSQDFTRRPPAPSPSPGVRPMPMAFPPDTTNTNTTNTTNMAITIEQPSSVSDSLDILERDEMPRQRQYQHQRQHQHQHQQHHAWPGPDTGQFDDKQSVATTPVPPYIDITPSLGFGVGTSIGSAGGGATATATPGGGLGVGVDLGGNGNGSGGGGSRRSSRRPTPSPHRTDRTTDRLDRLDRPQDRNLRASDRLRPPDLPLGAAPEIMTRSISLPVALERSYDNTGPPLSSSAAAATAIIEPPPQAQPLDAPITDQPHPPPTQSQTQTPHSPLLSSIPLPPHVSPLPDVPNVLTDDASAGIGVAAGASAGATGAGGITNLARPPPRPEDDAASMSSLELYSITPRPRGGSGNGDARSSMTMSEGVSLYSARAHFDSRSGSDE